MTTAAVPRGNGEEARPDGRSPRSVLGKVGLILSAFGDGDLTLSLTELTARTGVAKATVHRLCQELVACEMLERDGSDYRLGLLLYSIGLRAPRQRTLRHAARPALENLAQALDSPVSLSVPNGSDLLCIDNAGRHRNRAGASIGGRLLQLRQHGPGKAHPGPAARPVPAGATGPRYAPDDRPHPHRRPAPGRTRAHSGTGLRHRLRGTPARLFRRGRTRARAPGRRLSGRAVGRRPHGTPERTPYARGAADRLGGRHHPSFGDRGIPHRSRSPRPS
ncbi:hypothetical protein SANTM175S_03714 [Streptomyces antimycoticus]